MKHAALRTYLLPPLAVAGVLWALYVIARTNREVPAALPVSDPAKPPYASYVAGAGLIEASSENIAIGTPLPGIVTAVHARVGDRVKAGDPLFSLDDRVIKAELAVRMTALAVAEEQLGRLKAMPRPEDVAPVAAELAAGEAQCADLEHQLKLWESVGDKRAVSEDELWKRRFAVQVAKARLDEARARLALLKAGAWERDLAVARAQVESARAQAQAVKTDLERLTVRAPIDGRILQVKIRTGEFAQAGPLATPLMLMGNVDRLCIRVDIDENDAWRVARGASAIAYARGNRNISTPIEFVRFEPAVVPKRTLTGDSVERVDTRVLQVIYSFAPADLPLYVGQAMDVFIEAPPPDGHAPPTSAR